MSIVAEIRDFRGIISISTEDGDSLRVRKQHFMKRPLEAGDEVELDDYEGAIAAIQSFEAYEAALTSLDFCARTAKEVERTLLRKGYVPVVAVSVVERLRENGLIDDRQLAARIAESNANKAVGVYALKRKLRSKGISDDDAADALDCFDDMQQEIAAKAAAEKLYRRYSGLPTREARAKLSQALARRGFSWDAVRAAVDALLSDDADYE